ncbi:family 20 glycosylhydrolase [candidate division KSB1 bacterium]|nr:family 20 glycosylhydrolase [candidate division KSB1 bacterium]
MRIYKLFLILGVILSMNANSQTTLNLMPVPSQLEIKEGFLLLDESFTVKVDGEGSHRIYTAATRMLGRLAGRTGLFLAQDVITPATVVNAPVMTIAYDAVGESRLGQDESYTLDVTPESVVLKANTDIGALRGLETFLQLVDSYQGNYIIPSVSIEDSPRFPWRGLLIDVCRHFMPMEVIKRNLDGMAAVKMNVLHWHLTEDQGFRVESRTFPKLHQMGSDGFYYTQEQIRQIIDYADERGIRVMPEFDIPGHATSWFIGHPELASAPGPYRIERTWGIKDPTMDPTKEETYTFLSAFLGEMAQLFPDEYMHIGGDENNGKQWDANPDIQKYMKENEIEDNEALQSYFNNRILKILTQYDKKMVGWDEILHEDMPTDIVIQSWRGRDSMVKAARQGYQSLLSNGYYIDLCQSAEFHYLNDPIPADTPLTPEEQKQILGGEATMWAELVTWETVDSRIWPRTAAIAERLWSPGNVKDVSDMYRRLDDISIDLEELGLTHLKNHDMLLRRMAGQYDIEPLKILSSVLEPIEGYKRHSQGKLYTSYSPYTRMVDATHPDSRVARHFKQEVQQFLSDHDSEVAEDLKVRLVLWQNNHAKAAPIIDQAPILKEVEPLSQELSRLAEVALQAVGYIQTDVPAPAGWKDKALQSLSEAAEWRAEMEMVILPHIEELVRAVK